MREGESFRSIVKGEKHKGNMERPVSHRWCRQPAVFVLCAVHVPVKGEELGVAQVIHVHQVELPAGVVVALIVPHAGEVQPLRMTKFVTCEDPEGKLHSVKSAWS